MPSIIRENFTLNFILRVLLAVAFVFAACVVDAFAADDLALAARPMLRKFTDADGLPMNSVMSLRRDGNGFLWAGTQDGAGYFNGHKWKNVSLPNRTVSNYVYAIHAAADGAVWIGTDGAGVHRFKDGEWTTFDTSNGLVGNAIRAIAETRTEAGASVIWIGTREGLSRFSDGKFENFDAASGLPDKTVRALFAATDGSIWIGTSNGVARWSASGKRIFTAADGFPAKVVFSLLETSGDEATILAGTDSGLLALRGENWEKFAAESLPTAAVRSLARSVNQTGREVVFAGFDGHGLAIYEDGVWRLLEEKQGLSNDLVFALEDAGSNDGAVWISTLGAGVARLEPGNWMTFDDRNGLPNKIVFSTAETSGETFWFGTYGNGVARFAGGEWKFFKTADGLPNDWIHCFLRSEAEGREILYVGTERGLGKFENGKFSKIEIAGGKIQEIWDLHESVEADGSRTLWIAAGGGIVRRNGGSETVYTVREGIPDPRVRSILETTGTNGVKSLFFGTMGGLVRFENGELKAFTTKDGLPNNRIYTVAEIKDESASQIWIGTGGGGAAVFEPARPELGFRRISSENGHLPNDSVLKIVADRRGRIYLTTNRGVARLTPKRSISELDFHSYSFTTDDGLPSNECISGGAMVDSRGRVWVGTVGGSAILDLDRETADQTADPMMLERFLVGGIARTSGGEIEFAHTDNDFLFEFVLRSGSRESGTRYMTELDGLDDSKSEWTINQAREFSFLPAGEYVFRAWGMDAAGNVSAPLEVKFTVRAAWWRTWWALTGYFLALLAAISLIAFLIYRNRLRRIIELERVRARIATDLHDDLGASLSQIAIMSEILTNDRGIADEESRTALGKIAETARDVTSSMSDIVWAINPQRDNLGDLVQRMRHFASDILSAKDIDFAFFAPPADDHQSLGIDFRRQIYLFFKEAVNNAAKHSGCTEMTIRFEDRGDSLSLSVEDNGRGFDESSLPANAGGHGISSLRARAESVGGSLLIDSRPGSGTKIVLTAPKSG